MKIRITVSIDLNARKWAEYNGLDAQPGSENAALRADVRQHVLTTLQGSEILDEADAIITLVEL